MRSRHIVKARYAIWFALVSAVLAAPPLLAAPDLQVSQGTRTFIAQAAALGLGMLLLGTARWASIRAALNRGPGLPLAALVGWGCASFALTAPSDGKGRDVALLEVLRLTSGLLLFLSVAHATRSPRRRRHVASLIFTTAVVAAIVSTASYSPLRRVNHRVSLENKQMLAATAAVLSPAAVVLMASGVVRARRSTAWTAAALFAVSLLLMRNRTSWLSASAGGAVGALLLLQWNVRTTPKADRAALRGRGQTWLRATAAVVGMAAATWGALRLSGSDHMIRQRFNRNAMGTLDWRLDRWRAAAEMIRSRPVLGWGVGSYPMHAARFSDPGAMPPPEVIAREGSSLSSLAHNEYLQTGAELGLLGLGLYLLALGAFAVRGLRALTRPQPAPRAAVIIAALAAVTAQSVDAASNPAWRLADVSGVLFVLLGLGAAAAQGAKRRAA